MTQEGMIADFDDWTMKDRIFFLARALERAEAMGLNIFEPGGRFDVSEHIRLEKQHRWLNAEVRLLGVRTRQRVLNWEIEARASNHT